MIGKGFVAVWVALAVVACGKTDSGLGGRVNCTTGSECSDGASCVSGRCVSKSERSDAALSLDASRAVSTDAASASDAFDGATPLPPVEPRAVCPSLSRMDAGANQSVTWASLSDGLTPGVVHGGDGLAVFARDDSGGTGMVCIYDPATLAPKTYVGEPSPPLQGGGWFASTFTGGGVSASLLSCSYEGYTCGARLLVEGWPSIDLSAYGTLVSAPTALTVRPDGHVFIAYSDPKSMPEAIAVAEAVRGRVVKRGALFLADHLLSAKAIALDASERAYVLIHATNEQGTAPVDYLAEFEANNSSSESLPEEVTAASLSSNGDELILGGSIHAEDGGESQLWVTSFETRQPVDYLDGAIPENGKVTSVQALPGGGTLLTATFEQSAWVQKLTAKGLADGLLVADHADANFPDAWLQSDGSVLATNWNTFTLTKL